MPLGGQKHLIEDEARTGQKARAGVGGDAGAKLQGIFRHWNLLSSCVRNTGMVDISYESLVNQCVYPPMNVCG